MAEHETWCCRSPESQCAKAGGCSGSCNCGAGGGDRCRDVPLPSGETIRVRGRGGLGPAGVAALGELVEAARRKAAQNPPDEGTAALYERIEAALDRQSVSPLRDAAKQAGVKFSALFKIGQGRMPGAVDLAAIEKWLGATEDNNDTNQRPE